jgi:hypothetical protein
VADSADVDQQDTNQAQTDLAAGAGRAAMQDVLAGSAAYSGTVQLGDVSLTAQDVGSMKAFSAFWKESNKQLPSGLDSSVGAAKSITPQLASLAGMSQERPRASPSSVLESRSAPDYSNPEEWIKEVAGTEAGQKIPFFKSYMAALEAGYLGPQASLKDFAGGTPDREREPRQRRACSRRSSRAPGC